MNLFTQNALTRMALGIRSTEWLYYRSDRAYWKVTLESGEEFTVTTHYLGTEKTVLREAAEKLAKMGRPVEWPKERV